MSLLMHAYAQFDLVCGQITHHLKVEKVFFSSKSMELLALYTQFNEYSYSEQGTCTEQQ